MSHYEIIGSAKDRWKSEFKAEIFLNGQNYQLVMKIVVLANFFFIFLCLNFQQQSKPPHYALLWSFFFIKLYLDDNSMVNLSIFDRFLLLEII